MIPNARDSLGPIGGTAARLLLAVALLQVGGLVGLIAPAPAIAAASPYTLSPSPIAPNASLGTTPSVTVTLSTNKAGPIVYLLIQKTTAGGSAFVGETKTFPGPKQF